MSKKKRTIAEIWVGGASNPAYTFYVRSSSVSVGGKSVLITAEDGTEFETSPHNIVMITFEEEEYNEQRKAD